MTSKPGLVEMAENGTLFLDEFTEASTRVQAKLLRVLQERCFHRVGGTQTISVNFRLIAASNRDITHAVRQGLFRADLYYRVAVINLKIPPLRERKADILAIARYYLHFFRTGIIGNAFRIFLRKTAVFWKAGVGRGIYASCATSSSSRSS